MSIRHEGANLGNAALAVVGVEDARTRAERLRELLTGEAPDDTHEPIPLGSQFYDLHGCRCTLDRQADGTPFLRPTPRWEYPELQGEPQPVPVKVRVKTFRRGVHKDYDPGTYLYRYWSEDPRDSCQLCSYCQATFRKADRDGPEGWFCGHQVPGHVNERNGALFSERPGALQIVSAPETRRHKRSS